MSPACAAATTTTTNDALCSVRTFRPFADVLSERGVSLWGELHDHGLSDADLMDPDLRIAHNRVASLLKRAIKQSGLPSLGVLAAERVRPGDFGVMEYAAASCATQGESMRCAARYLGLMHEGLEVSVEQHGERVAMVLRMADGLESVPATIEFALAALLINGRRLTGRDLVPLEVSFCHQGPQDTSAHKRVFQAPVRFGASANAIWMDKRATELPMFKADPRLNEILQQHARQQMGALPKRQRFSQQVLGLIREELSGGNPGVEHVASRLHISPRTLHRRLKEEGTTHKQLVDELRRSLALRMLQDEDQPIGEISYQLGFSHVNAFHKAFKRWTSETPAQYRDTRRARAVY